MKRRNFIKLGALTAAAATTGALPDLKAQEAENQEPRKTLRVGLIGTGWYGNVDLYCLMQVGQEGSAAYGVDVVALCDVDRDALENTKRRVAERQDGREPETFHDYREMLAKSALDVVLIGTPDHWHALTTIAAIEAGCDVYVQKPIGVDVRECQAMLAAARKNNAVVQVGMQRRSTTHLMRAKELFVDSGKLGRVGQAQVFSFY